MKCLISRETRAKMCEKSWSTYKRGQSCTCTHTAILTFTQYTYGNLDIHTVHIRQSWHSYSTHTAILTFIQYTYGNLDIHKQYTYGNLDIHTVHIRQSWHSHSTHTAILTFTQYTYGNLDAMIFSNISIHLHWMRWKVAYHIHLSSDRLKKVSGNKISPSCGSSSNHPKLLGLRLHNPGQKNCVTKQALMCYYSELPCDINIEISV